MKKMEFSFEELMKINQVAEQLTFIADYMTDEEYIKMQEERDGQGLSEDARKQLGIKYAWMDYNTFSMPGVHDEKEYSVTIELNSYTKDLKLYPAEKKAVREIATALAALCSKSVINARGIEIPVSRGDALLTITVKNQYIMVEEETSQINDYLSLGLKGLITEALMANFDDNIKHTAYQFTFMDSLTNRWLCVIAVEAEESIEPKDILEITEHAFRIAASGLMLNKTGAGLNICEEGDNYTIKFKIRLDNE